MSKRTFVKLCGYFLVLTAVVFFIYVGLKLCFADPAKIIYESMIVKKQGFNNCGIHVLKILFGFNAILVLSSVVGFAGIEMICNSELVN